MISVPNRELTIRHAVGTKVHDNSCDNYLASSLNTGFTGTGVFLMSSNVLYSPPLLLIAQQSALFQIYSGLKKKTTKKKHPCKVMLPDYKVLPI